jgi:hypothetical protein
MPSSRRALRAAFLVLVAAVLAALPATPATAQKLIVGEHVRETFETPDRYPAPDGAPGAPELVWRDEIRYPGATYIAPHFASMHLPPGDFVVVRSPDGEQHWRYTRFGKRDLGRTPEGFFAAHIKGDTAVIELWSRRGPASGARGYGYRIDLYGRGFNDVELQEMWDAGLGEKMNLAQPSAVAPGGGADWGRIFEKSLCGTDDTEEAKCYETSEPSAYQEARSVARLLLNGNAHCTGWLIGCEGHVMTNQHCIGSQSQANDIDFEFDAEGATCATDCSSALACPGTIEASGGTLIAVDSGLDYALVLPDTSTGGGTDLNAAYGYMQLRDTGPTLGERLYVPQHPAGWGKRLAMESSHALDTSGFVEVQSLTEPACQAGGPTNGETGYYGDTQGGSSGSPVLAYSDDRVVALHHCRGGAACTGTGGDPNRGVPIDLVIDDLGASLPACAIDTCEPQPVADAGPDRSICLGDSTTVGTPAQAGHSYSWSPTGATTAQVNVSPSSTTSYTVTATTTCGSAQDSVVVSVDDGSGGGLSDDFEGDTSGWSTSGLWHKTADSACASPGYSSPVNAFYYGQDSTCTYDTGGATTGTLTSPPISGITASSTLTFDYYREVESYTGGSYDQTEVEVVTGSGSTTVFSLDSTDASAGAWVSSGAIDLSAFAGQQIQIRFRFDSVDGVSNGFTGWLVDDVVVTGESACTPGNTAPSVTITAPADGSTFTEGTSVGFSGTASDAEDGDLSSSLSWSSDLDGAIGSGASFSTSTLSVGSHTVTASVTDSGGLGGSDSIGVTIEADTGQPGAIDWNATGTVAYSNQDGSGSVTVEDGGATLALEGNRWRRTTDTYTITPYTVVEVDFMSTSEGEIHGIGFDEDDTLTNDVRIFQLDGTQAWTSAHHHYDGEYTTPGVFKTYKIPVGAFYTGSGFRLVLVNDKDSGTLDNDSRFRNVRIYEETPTVATIDFDTYGMTAYSNQDGSGSVAVEDSGATLFLTGNRWRRSTGTYTLTPNTVVAFDYQSTVEGEIHGIGFDEDDTLTNDLRIFRFFGTQSWASDIDWVRTYDAGDVGTFKTFVIPVGREYTGSGFRLVFVNDNDAGTTNTGRFRNVRVYELD